MAFKFADRVRDVSTTTGTGAFTVSGTAPTGYRTFSAVCSVSDTLPYFIAHRAADEWEVGKGTYSSANTLTRTTVTASSNAGAAVNFSAGTKDVVLALISDLTTMQNWFGVGGGGGGTPAFFPQDNEPPSSSFATIDTRNGHPVLDFDDTVSEAAVFTGILSNSYSGTGLTVKVAYSATSATSGTIGWTVEIERVGDSQLDIDSDSFASAQTITAVTVPGTAGFVDVVSVNISNGANMDSLAAGEQYRIRIKRDVANDNAAGDAELHWVSVEPQ
jgi:hypothetical protein